MFVGTFVGGTVPVLFGSDVFSIASIVGNTVGGVIGIVIAYKAARSAGL